MQFKIKPEWKKYISLIGGFLIFMVLSAIYVFGLIFIYISSHLKNQGNSSITTADLNIVAVIANFTNAISVAISPKLQEFLHERIMTMTCSVFLCLSWFLLSFANTLWVFILILGIMLPFFEGLLYLIPIYNVQHHFPDKKGTISGILFIGYGVGTFIWNPLLFILINPNNEKPYYDENNKEEYFYEEVTKHMPKAFSVFSLVLLITSLIGCLLLQRKQDTKDKNQLIGIENKIIEKNSSENEKDQKEISSPSNKNKDSEITMDSQKSQKNIIKEKLISQDDTNQENKKELKNFTEFPTLKEAIFQKATLQFMAVFLTGICFGFMFALNYKSYGLLHIEDDRFFTIIANCNAVANGLCRFLWGILFDKFGFKILALINLGTQIVLTTLIQFISSSKPLFLVTVFILFSNYVGWWVLGPSMVTQMFGVDRGKQVYGVVYTTQIISAIIQLLTVKFLPWEVIFFLYVGIMVTGFVICYLSRFQLFDQKQINLDSIININQQNNNNDNEQSSNSLQKSNTLEQYNSNINQNDIKNIELQIRSPKNSTLNLK